MRIQIIVHVPDHINSTVVIREVAQLVLNAFKGWVIGAPAPAKIEQIVDEALAMIHGASLEARTKPEVALQLLRLIEDTLQEAKK